MTHEDLVNYGYKLEDCKILKEINRRNDQYNTIT